MQKMPQTPTIKVSIVTVCYNAAETITRTLESVASQKSADIEYIVVDGGSTDRTMEIVRSFGAVVTQVVSERDNGIFDAMNKGVRMATGDAVYFLNADDYFVDDHVVRDIAQAFAEDAARTLVYGNVVVMGGPDGMVNPPAKAFRNRSISEFLHNSFCHQAVFARRSLFTTVGVFDLDYKYSADYEWMIRAFKANRQGFHFLDRKIANYFYLGRSRQFADITRREVRKMHRQHLLSAAYVWYYFRYVLVRGFKKRLLNEAY